MEVWLWRLCGALGFGFFVLMVIGGSKHMHVVLYPILVAALLIVEWRFGLPRRLPSDRRRGQGSD
jgi:hypothetical protein